MQAYQELRARLDGIRNLPHSKEKVWRAYLFAALSVQTPLARHELAYATVIQAFPSPESVTGFSQELFQLLKGRVVYHGQKLVAILEAAQVIPTIPAQVWDMPDYQLREYLAETLPGISRAKASFMCMLLGYYKVACLDVHMLAMLGERINITRSARLYRQAERKLAKKQPAGLTQWVRWCTKMSVPINDSHAVYFKSQSLNKVVAIV